MVLLRRVRTMSGHTARVGTMAWSSHLLSSGSRDASILQRDPRAPEDFQHKLSGHRSEVGFLCTRCQAPRGLPCHPCRTKHALLLCPGHLIKEPRPLAKYCKVPAGFKSEWQGSSCCRARSRGSSPRVLSGLSSQCIHVTRLSSRSLVL